MSREVIPNYYAYLLKTGGKTLTTSKKKVFFECINTIYRENDKVIYRGDKKTTLLMTYGIDEKDFPLEFNRSLFVMGQKARMFLTKQSPGIAEIGIAEATENKFGLIFRMLKNLLNREFPFSANRNAMRSFRASESELFAFFRDPQNEQYFVDRTNSLSARQKTIIRDYYLALLHHIDKSEYYTSSFLLSTTTSFKQAHNFAWNGEHENSNNALIFFGWVPKRYEGLLSVPNTAILKQKINIAEIKLPIYERSFFPNQQEVTLKGGLLPHYLLGYLYTYRGKEIFEINPALFETGEGWNGIELPIDQSSFNERIQNTTFARYFSLDENDLYEEHTRI